MEYGMIIKIAYFIYTCVICCVKTEIWLSHNNESYFFSDEDDKPNWETALMKCGLRDAKLVVISNEVQANFLADQLPRYGDYFPWIGLKANDSICTCIGVSDQDCEDCRDNWVWYDGSPMTYREWFPRRPLGNGRACGVLRPSGHFDASSCASVGRFPYICQHTCTPEPCMKASCQFEHDVYKCNCEEGYIGTHCDRDVNKCESNPCMHGGICLDELNRYSCDCENTGYDGATCGSEIDECSSGPCMNGGVCIDKLNAFQCQCQNTGYKGYTCEQAIQSSSLQSGDNGDSYKIATAVLATIAVLFMVGFGVSLAYNLRKARNSKQIQTNPVHLEAHVPTAEPSPYV